MFTILLSCVANLNTYLLYLFTCFVQKKLIVNHTLILQHASQTEHCMSTTWQIFCLGTNNWQGGGEFAPGSGILHEGHHESLRALPNVTGCFSMWPSRNQRTNPDRKDYRVFALEHDIPICESISPVSSYRWHSMSEDEFNAYRTRLANEVEAFINDAEAETGIPFNLFIAHHTFVNPTVMVEINRRRTSAGKPRVPVVVFAHGTALKMYQNELKQSDEYPLRFYPWIQEQKIFDKSAGNVDGVFVIANAQHAIFNAVFPEFDPARVVVAPNGYNQKIFHKVPNATPASVFIKDTLPAKYYASIAEELAEQGAETVAHVTSTQESGIPTAKFDRLVLFTGKFADWKRLDVMLKAAAQYRVAGLAKGVSIGTLIAGGGPPEDELLYKRLAYVELKAAEHVFFLGPLGQDLLTRVNTVVDLGVFPSKDEPFGLVFIECMACGTPVLGARSGGPIDFVTDAVGALIEEHADHDVLAQRFADKVVEVIVDQNWKATKGADCINYAVENFSLKAQCAQILENVWGTFLGKAKL
jgi:glycosyltransferase involved in cell wall biosynthesis